MADLTTGGGIAGGIAAIAYAAKMVFEARRENAETNAKVKSTPVSDAAAANAILLTALQEERSEVQRLTSRVDELQQVNADLYDKMARQKRDYEAEVRELRDQLAEFSQRLEHLQVRIQSDLPPL